MSFSSPVNYTRTLGAELVGLCNNKISKDTRLFLTTSTIHINTIFLQIISYNFIYNGPYSFRKNLAMIFISDLSLFYYSKGYSAPGLVTKALVLLAAKSMRAVASGEAFGSKGAILKAAFWIAPLAIWKVGLYDYNVARAKALVSN